MTLAVVGLGTVGLPVACLFAHRGFSVVGVDSNRERIIDIEKGEVLKKDPLVLTLLKEVLLSGSLALVSKLGAGQFFDVVVIAVETNVSPDGLTPNWGPLCTALHDAVPRMHNQSLLIVESTLAPHTMNNVVVPIVERLCVRHQIEDVELAYCPERLAEGKLLENLISCPRVIGTSTSVAASVARLFYRQVVSADIDATDFVTAEFVKTVENTYRDVQIAFANEVALLCENSGTDIFQIRKLVNKSPQRHMHLPGPGVGGTCIPKDPLLLVYGAEGRKTARLIRQARVINNRMPSHVFDLIKDGLSEAGKRVKKASILILGFAYRADSGNTHNSPSETLVRMLKKAGANIQIHDPNIQEKSFSITNEMDQLDCIVFMVKHREYGDFPLTDTTGTGKKIVLVDCIGLIGRTAAESAGFFYRGIGN